MFRLLALYFGLSLLSPGASALNLDFDIERFSPKTPVVYFILGVEPDVSQAELKKAAQKLLMQYHPDHGGDPEMGQKISDAYAQVNTEKRRARYDYAHGLGRRPKDMASGTPIAEISLKSAVENSDAYRTALNESLRLDNNLLQAAAKWSSFPARLRMTIMPRISSYVGWSQIMISGSFLSAALSSESIAGQMIWATAAYLAQFGAATWIVVEKIHPRTAPKRIVKEYVEALGSTTDQLRASLVAFDVVYDAASQVTKHKLTKWQDVYLQVRLDRLARSMPAIAKGQLLRYLSTFDTPELAPWRDTFKAELLSRPKYWLGQLEPLLEAIKENKLDSSLLVRASVIEDDLKEQTKGEAFKQRMRLHVKRSCEAALQTVGALVR